jgi:hypothetical protein
VVNAQADACTATQVFLKVFLHSGIAMPDISTGHHTQRPAYAVPTNLKIRSFHMSMQQRSPGPWRPAVNINGWVKVSDGTGKVVASIKKAGDVPVICMAPALLEMVKRVIDGRMGFAPAPTTKELDDIVNFATGYKPMPGGMIGDQS